MKLEPLHETFKKGRNLSSFSYEVNVGIVAPLYLEQVAITLGEKLQEYKDGRLTSDEEMSLDNFGILQRAARTLQVIPALSSHNYEDSLRRSAIELSQGKCLVEFGYRGQGYRAATTRHVGLVREVNASGFLLEKFHGFRSYSWEKVTWALLRSMNNRLTPELGLTVKGVAWAGTLSTTVHGTVKDDQGNISVVNSLGFEDFVKDTIAERKANLDMH